MSFGKYFKENGGPLIFWAATSGVAIAVGVFWPSFYWLVIGSILLLGVLSFSLYPFFVKESSNDGAGQSIGCCVFLLMAVVTILNIAYSGTRYISSASSEQHRYADCGEIAKSKDVLEVSRLEGFFHFCFSECEKCEQRRVSEKKQRRANEKIKELQEDIVELQEKIDVKQSQIEALRNGADVDDMDFEEEYEEEYYEEDEMEPAHLRYDPSL